MKITPILLTLCLILPVSMFVKAGSGAGTVNQLLVGRNGHEVYVEIVGEISNFSCSESHPSGFNFGFSLSDHNAAKEMLAVLTAAQLSGKQVLIQGEGVCTSYDPRLESASYVILQTDS